MKRQIKLLLIICLLFLSGLTSIPISNANTINANSETTINSNDTAPEEIEIKVAIYDSYVFRSPKKIYSALNYSWIYNNTTYKFNAKLIYDKQIYGRCKEDEKLTNENYDVFIIAATMRQFPINMGILFQTDRAKLSKIYNFLPEDKLWLRNVKRFIENGGGYIGICGGANIGSLGCPIRNTQDNSISDLMTLFVHHLGIAKVFSNDHQWQEWMYAWKEPFDEASDDCGVPINCSVNYDHPIFAGYAKENINLRWWAGPGLYLPNENLDYFDDKLGEVTWLSTYLEEPMEKAPIHKWIERRGVSQPVWRITTDIKGDYAGIAATYNEKGRIVLYGPHPEHQTMFGGRVDEFKTFTPYRFLTMVWPFRADHYGYNWTDGVYSPVDYTWWLVRRSTAWVAHISDDALPPIEYFD